MLGTQAGAVSWHAVKDVLLVGFLEEGSDQLDWLCHSQSPHLRASFINAYFSQPYFSLVRTDLLNLQPRSGLSTSGPLSNLLGMERC